MRVILLTFAICTVLYAYAWQLSHESRTFVPHTQPVYSNRGAIDAEVMPC